ncbi:hypothetical protein O3P69_000424 [Scylla paramamosain]|uniref:40S ribosomal protein S12 n=1 Tax=Scylla paramamosain TaxID=85552 RepID=A0AAW0UXA2_SCYPA
MIQNMVLTERNNMYVTQNLILITLLFIRRQAYLCILANNCDEPGYSKLVEALCQEHQIKLLKVDSNKKLGEWAGLCKIDREGKARKVVGCSCVVVTDYGKETQAHDVFSCFRCTSYHHLPRPAVRICCA